MRATLRGVSPAGRPGPGRAMADGACSREAASEAITLDHTFGKKGKSDAELQPAKGSMAKCVKRGADTTCAHQCPRPSRRSHAHP